MTEMLPWLTAAPPDLRLTMYSLIVVAVVGIGFAILYRQYAFKQLRRAVKAEAQLHELWMEAQEDAALARETEAWKAGIDPRIAKASPETIERIWHDIKHGFPVRPSPVAYVANPDAEFCPRVVEVE